MTPEVAARYGAAFGQLLSGRFPGAREDAYVIVGRDSRTSGALLAEAAAAGLRAAGVSVRDAGIAPTPTLLLAVRDDEQAIGALVLTASHNPIQWNGLKLASETGGFVPPETGLEVQRLFEEGPRLADWSGLGRGGTLEGVAERHIDRILALPILDVDAVRRRAPRVALDCVHGAGGVVVPQLLDRLGCRVTGIGLEPDGLFPRDPEPVPANLEDLRDRVRSSGAEIGMAVDPDGDRLALVDGDGTPVGEDWTLALAAEYLLGRKKGPVVTNLSSSQSIQDVADRAGVPFHRSPVGEARVAAKMREVGAVVGGEGNGGVMLPDLNLTRDAAVAAALVLNLLAERNATLEEILAGRRRYHVVKRKVERSGRDLDAVYERMRGVVPRGAVENTEDGLRFEWPGEREWLHVRPSGTEPILRIIAEAPSVDRAAELADMAGRGMSDEGED